MLNKKSETERQWIIILGFLLSALGLMSLFFVFKPNKPMSLDLDHHVLYFLFSFSIMLAGVLAMWIGNRLFSAPANDNPPPNLELMDQAFCRSCGGANDQHARFCNECGNEL